MLQLKSYRSDDDSDVHSATEINQMLHEKEKEKPLRQTRTLISIGSVEHTDNSQDSVSGKDSSNSS